MGGELIDEACAMSETKVGDDAKIGHEGNDQLD